MNALTDTTLWIWYGIVFGLDGDGTEVKILQCDYTQVAPVFRILDATECVKINDIMESAVKNGSEIILVQDVIQQQTPIGPLTSLVPALQYFRTTQNIDLVKLQNDPTTIMKLNNNSSMLVFVSGDMWVQSEKWKPKSYWISANSRTGIK